MTYKIESHIDVCENPASQRELTHPPHSIRLVGPERLASQGVAVPGFKLSSLEACIDGLWWPQDPSSRGRALTAEQYRL